MPVVESGGVEVVQVGDSAYYLSEDWVGAFNQTALDLVASRTVGASSERQLLRSLRGAMTEQASQAVVRKTAAWVLESGNPVDLSDTDVVVVARFPA